MNTSGWREKMKWLLRMTAIAVIYGIVARYSLLLAFENTNASPVWPPSGIAFAAVLFFGYRVWPGIALGAFGANIFTLIANGASGILPVLFASFLIGIGNTLEAVLGVFLLAYTQGFTLGYNIVLLQSVGMAQ